MYPIYGIVENDHSENLVNSVALDASSDMPRPPRQDIAGGLGAWVTRRSRYESDARRRTLLAKELVSNKGMLQAAVRSSSRRFLHSLVARTAKHIYAYLSTFSNIITLIPYVRDCVMNHVIL